MAWSFARTPSHSYLRTTSDPPPQWGASDFTVSLWFKVADVTQAHTLLKLEHTETNNRYLLIADGTTANDPVKWIAQVGGTQYPVTTTSYSAGAWATTGLTKATTSGVFDYTPSGGNGTYYFAVVAKDSLLNESLTPINDGDCSTVCTAP